MTVYNHQIHKKLYHYPYFFLLTSPNISLMRLCKRNNGSPNSFFIFYLTTWPFIDCAVWKCKNKVFDLYLPRIYSKSFWGTDWIWTISTWTLFKCFWALLQLLEKDVHLHCMIKRYQGWIFQKLITNIHQENSKHFQTKAIFQKVLAKIRFLVNWSLSHDIRITWCWVPLKLKIPRHTNYNRSSIWYRHFKRLATIIGFVFSVYYLSTYK